MFYELAASSWGQEEIDAINACRQRPLHHGRQCPGTSRKQFAAFFGARYAVMVNSGSSANLAALARPLLQEAPAAPARRRSHRSRHFLGHDLSSASAIWPEAALRRCRTRQRQPGRQPARARADAAHPHDHDRQHLGQSGRAGRDARLCRQHGLYLSRTIASRWAPSCHGRQAGTFGDLGTFSFFFSHHISTMEGGMVVTDDEELCHLMRSIRAHGWTRDLPPDSRRS